VKHPRSGSERQTARAGREPREECAHRPDSPVVSPPHCAECTLPPRYDERAPPMPWPSISRVVRRTTSLNRQTVDIVQFVPSWPLAATALQPDTLGEVGLNTATGPPGATRRQQGRGGPFGRRPGSGEVDDATCGWRSDRHPHVEVEPSRRRRKWEVAARSASENRDEVGSRTGSSQAGPGNPSRTAVPADAGDRGSSFIPSAGTDRGRPPARRK